jgi:hypothetical protein
MELFRASASFTLEAGGEQRLEGSGSCLIGKGRARAGSCCRRAAAS